jgi:predicted ATP-grasp superfamily ATP-dependent carboligase
MREKPRILLTGGRAPATLDLARLFHRAGCTVFVADSCRSPIAKGSAAVHKTFHVCEPKSKRAAFIADLLDIIRQEAIDLLIPTCEEVFYIAQALPQLSAHCTVFADRFEKLAALHSNGRLPNV